FGSDSVASCRIDHRRVLHFLPTRRSSDLDAAWEREAARLGRVTLAVYDWPGADRSTALGTAVSQAVPSESAALVANKHAPFVMVDRKSTRLNSSHVKSSYAVFCLKKKKHN